MIQPEIKRVINGYEFTVGGLYIKVSRIVAHSGGRVTGELFISRSDGTITSILLPGSEFNFSSEQTRQRYAQQMRAKFSDDSIEWREIFDYLGHKVQELARSTEPSSEIWASDEIPELEYLLEPLIIQNQSNIIFGAKGANKSTIAYLAGAIVLLPWVDNPLALTPGATPIKTLVLDWETDQATFEYYLARIKRGCDAPPFNLNYKHCILPLAEDIEDTQREIQTTGAKLLIIDSLAAAAGGEDNELKGSQSALRFNSALRKLGLPSLIIAQTAKPNSADGQQHRKTIYGSVIFTYYARNIFELCGSEDDTNIKHLALFHRECNLARKAAPIGIRLTYNDDRSISVEREPVSVAEFAEKLSATARILDYLKHSTHEVKEMAEDLEIPANTIRVALTRLAQNHKVVKVGNGYGLSVQ